MKEENAPAQTTSDPPAKIEIRSRLGSLLRDDRNRRTEALREISKKTRPAFQALEIECGETGHEWKFDHWNFTHEYAWDKCVWCGALEGAEKHAVKELDA